MDGFRDCHSKSDTGRPMLKYIAYIWNLKNGRNELIYKTERVLDVKIKLLGLPWWHSG